MSDYQVIIIGGRPAGASLAIRLGRQGIKTLLVDKMTFPSLPSVPSSPFAYSHHIEMLEELGIPQTDVFYPDGRIDAFVMTFIGHFNVEIPISRSGAKYPYIFGADREKFDTALWEHAAKYESVTARSGFSVTGILKDNGKVVGIKGQSERGKEETFTADLVVGADGRFSFAAQQFGAEVIEEHNQNMSSSYHADWENVDDDIVPHSASLYNTGKGFMVIMIPIDTRKYIIGTYLRPQQLDSDKSVEERYLEGLQRVPELQARLKNARRVNAVVGVKNIRNGYRQPFGEGWALVGDAFHYKDPLDGQGMYDAMLSAKLLAEAIGRWQQGSQTWMQAGSAYKEQAIALTRPMLLQTVGRVKRELFSDPPTFIVKTLIRWTLSSPEYQRDFLRLLTRASDPAKWQSPGVMRRAIGRGIVNSVLRRKPAGANERTAAAASGE